ncbi:MAG: trypsin-like peptidase domain-containing protein [Patescibacteria group bacterium]
MQAIGVRSLRALALLSLLACSESCLPPPTAREFSDTADARWRLYASTVRIMIQCADGSGGWGSGVAVSPRHVLTARHVIDACEGEPWVITASLYDRKASAEMVVERISDTTDAARLVVVGLEEPFRYWADAAATDARAGDLVCASAFDPDFFIFQCGYVTGAYDSIVFLGFRIVGGNSGGPIFRNGQLVALVVARSINPARQHIGMAVPLSAWRDLLPPPEASL